MSDILSISLANTLNLRSDLLEDVRHLRIFFRENYSRILLSKDRKNCGKIKADWKKRCEEDRGI